MPKMSKVKTSTKKEWEKGEKNPTMELEVAMELGRRHVALGHLTHGIRVSLRY